MNSIISDAAFWNRLHFGFTLVYHYLFPQLTMGLAWFLVYWKWKAFQTGEEKYNQAARFWAKIFGVNFAVGVVTGIPMEFQFGTNWANFSRYAGGVIGQTLAMEGMFAFFLESAFVGALIWGEKRLGPRNQGCWAHARRKFFEALKLNPKDQSAIRIVAQMDELFAIDARARERGLSHPDRDVVRQQRARPLLQQIKASIETARLDALPKSALAKACNYTLTLWQRLTRFLDYPVLELSNNLAENAIRPVALGRKNWIHLGSQEAGPRIAAIISVVQSCRRLKIPVRDYLGSILPGLANMPMHRIPELTPAAWAASRK